MKSGIAIRLFLWMMLVLSKHNIFASGRMDSLDYTEIKTLCFDCINRNQDMLRQAIGNLEKIDSNDLVVSSRSIFYQDFSYAYFLLTNDNGDYLAMSKTFAERAIFYSASSPNYFLMATIYHRERKCDSMEMSLQKYIELYPKDKPMDTTEMDLLRNTCNKQPLITH